MQTSINLMEPLLPTSVFHVTYWHTDMNSRIWHNIDPIFGQSCNSPAVGIVSKAQWYHYTGCFNKYPCKAPWGPDSKQEIALVNLPPPPMNLTGIFCWNTLYNDAQGVSEEEYPINCSVVHALLSPDIFWCWAYMFLVRSSAVVPFSRQFSKQLNRHLDMNVLGMTRSHKAGMLDINQLNLHRPVNKSIWLKPVMVRVSQRQ
jgi:hypothetical protein